MKRTMCAFLILAMLVHITACASQQMGRKKTGIATGTAAGAAVGAGLGQAIGKDAESTLIGAAAGAVLGGLAGWQIAAYMDRQEQKLKEAIAESEAITLARTENVLTATFKGDVLFDVDSAALNQGAYAEIDRVSQVLNEFPRTRMRVEGHTDTTGSEDYNQGLSERRAESVKNALVQHNVDPNRVETVGFGESMPISDENALNRRVDIVIIPLGQE